MACRQGMGTPARDDELRPIVRQGIAMDPGDAMRRARAAWMADRPEHS